MRDAAAALNKAVREGSQDAADKAISALNQSCDDCHAVFHKGAEKESGKKE
jgi:cytochrome c556